MAPGEGKKLEQNPEAAATTMPGMTLKSAAPQKERAKSSF